MAEEQNLTGYFSGDTLKIEVTVNDEDGNALDVSLATFIWELAREVGQSPLVEKSSGSGIEFVNDGTDGLIEITVDPSDTADVFSQDGSPFYHELEMTDNLSQVSTVLYGTFEVNRDQID